MSEKRWETLRSRYLIKRWWMNLREDHVRMPNGVEMPEYHILEYPNWACVVALTDQDEVVMVEQYRYGIDEITLELPGGALEPNEDILLGIQRELLEETGYVAENWTYLGPCAPDPSRHTNNAHLFFARQAHRVQHQTLDESEDLYVRLVPVQTLLQKADTGQIRHGIHLTAIFWATYRGCLAKVSPDTP